MGEHRRMSLGVRACSPIKPRVPAQSRRRDMRVSTVEEVVIAAIATARRVYDESTWVTWADAWLSGRERSPVSALIAIAAAAEDVDFSERDPLRTYAALAARNSAIAAARFATSGRSFGICSVEEAARHAISIGRYVLELRHRSRRYS